MNRKLLALLAAGLFAFAVSASADDTQPAQPSPSSPSTKSALSDQATPPAAKESAAPALPPGTPPAELQKLAAFLGRWDSEQHVFPMEGVPESRSKATADYRWVMNGMHLEGVQSFVWNGKPVEGRTIWSYDPDRKEYTCVWMDGMSPKTYTYEGDFTNDGKLIVKMSEMQKDKAINHLITFAFPTPDTYTMRYDTDMKGSYQPMMEESGKRTAAGAKEAMQKKPAPSKKKG
jgi:uncharacterized protein DUF1579